MLGGLSCRHLRAQAVNHGGRSAGLRLELRGIEHCDQVSSLYLCSFIDEQFCEPALHLRADDDLIRIDGTDQHQVFRTGRGQEVISQCRGADDGEKDENAVTAVHFLLLSSGCWNKAAEMKSSTAARRCAKNSGENGSRPVTMRMTGAFVK